MIDTLTLAAIPAEDEALRGEVRAFIRDKMNDVPAHVRARSWAGFDAGFSRALAERGWVGMTLPKRYGGGGAARSRASCCSRSCWPPARRWRRTGSPIARARR